MQCSGGLESYGKRKKRFAENFNHTSEVILELSTTPMTPEPENKGKLYQN